MRRITSLLAVGAAGLALAAPAAADEPATYLAAGLNGANEGTINGPSPFPDQPNPIPAGDVDGRGSAVVRIDGDQVSYAVRWEGVATPTAVHIHAGGKGVNGAIRVAFLTEVLPDSARAVTGTVTVNDAALLDALRETPGDFYVNLHTAQFPNGAIRAQLNGLNRPVELDGVLNTEVIANLDSDADGFDVRDPKPFGDLDGEAEWLVNADGDELAYAVKWKRLAPVTAGRIHAGKRGKNGPAVADLFADADGLPATVSGIAGTVPVAADVAAALADSPRDHYTNLTTTAFPGGAVRGQLSKAFGSQANAVNAPVLGGAQIYSCRPAVAGGNAFQQFGVAAVLRGNIQHSFVQPIAGPPQWQAPDGSSVTGTLVRPTPNPGTIAELVLDATRTGSRDGLLGGTKQILRLNTSGGLAPTGACDLGAIATSQYKADYLFLD